MRTDLLGIIFSNAADEVLREMTAVRCLGSVPFGGRYRLIDFTLSNMVNAGVSKVAVITKNNYRSLIDHLGSGKPWDLARKKGGLSIFPPFINYGEGVRTSRIEQLLTILPLLEMSTQEFVIMSDCDTVSNIDIESMVKAHCDKNADITVAYKRGMIPQSFEGRMVFGIADKGRIADIQCSPDISEPADFSLNIAVLRRELLIRMIKDARARNFTRITRDILQPAVSSYALKIYGYEITAYTGVIDSVKSYLETSMDLLKADVRRQLFYTGRTVYTKVRDEMPVRYGLGATVKNCLIADGCIIEGSAENCVLFRGVRISPGAVLKNSIVMQGSVISPGVEASYIICDKNVTVTDNRRLSGCATYPAFFEKGSVV